jgi:methionyl-tRNA synthetase
LGAALPAELDRALSEFDFRAATDAIWAVVAAANRFIEAERPWEPASRDGDHLDAVLATLVGACRRLAVELSPFLPEGAARISARLGTGRIVGSAVPAFPRLTAGDVR